MKHPQGKRLPGAFFLKQAALTCCLAGLFLPSIQAPAQTGRREPEAVSLLGKPLYPETLPEDVRTKRETELEKAREDFRRTPDHPIRIIWLGRRNAYLGRYRQAIKIFSDGIEKYPDNAKLYRHRGHRYITVRELDKAVADLEKATQLIQGKPDEIEPDGLPNTFNTPRSTSHSNIWYHLGLAYYLKGDFENALRSYRACMPFSEINDDMLCATSHWLYMTCRRLGLEKEASEVLRRIKDDMEIMENQSYHKLLLMYQGGTTPEEVLSGATADGVTAATEAYGVANWYLYNGQTEQAKRMFGKILEGSAWAAFGYIAAEADLMRLQ